MGSPSREKSPTKIAKNKIYLLSDRDAYNMYSIVYWFLSLSKMVLLSKMALGESINKEQQIQDVLFSVWCVGSTRFHTQDAKKKSPIPHDMTFF